MVLNYIQRMAQIECKSLDMHELTQLLTILDPLDTDSDITRQALVDLVRFYEEKLATTPPTKVISPTRPPTDEPGRWERGLDPWHADAFPPEYKSQARQDAVRRSGWYELDWAKNVIGFIPDGTILR